MVLWLYIVIVYKRMIKEYCVDSIIFPEGYVTIVMHEEEFKRILSENFNKKNKAIVYVWNNMEYYIDTRSHIVLACSSKKV